MNMKKTNTKDLKKDSRSILDKKSRAYKELNLYQKNGK
jgi:hypothetical protein